MAASTPTPTPTFSSHPAAAPSAPSRPHNILPPVNRPPVPPGFTPYTENSATILLPSTNTAFLNPVQEYNRDLSVAVIKEWSVLRTEEFKAKWEKSRARGSEKRKEKKAKQKASATDGSNPTSTEAGLEEVEQPVASSSTAVDPTLTPSTLTSTPTPTPTHKPHEFHAQKYTLIEALSATGLRSIRYAQELPNFGLILANDFSPSACEAMKRNVDYNSIGVEWQQGHEEDAALTVARGKRRKRYTKAGVVVNEGDACTLLYNHRGDNDHVDVVDLDPYGTAAPFIDGAVQAVADGGLLCVTCTDLAVLAGQNYPEKCFANYGGTPAKAEYTHEAALRLVLNSISTTAARYGKYIEPLVSLSIDFYVRVFVRVHVGQQKVKETFSNHGTVYVCTFCQSSHIQPFGRIVEKLSKKNEVVSTYKYGQGPPAPHRCEHCGQGHHVAGPMWLGPLHKPEFIDRVLQRLEESDKDLYKTYPRIKGMLAVARDELPDLFFVTPAKIASLFRAQSPGLAEFASGLINGGFKVSRSHTTPGSIKTDAPIGFVHDVMREWIKKMPVRKDKVSDGSPTLVMLNKEQTHEVSLEIVEDAKKLVAKNDLVRYQANPTANWGPAARAKVVKASSLAAAAEAAAPTAAATEVEVDGGAEAGAMDEEEAMMNAMVDVEAEAERGVKRGGDELDSARPVKK